MLLHDMSEVFLDYLLAAYGEWFDFLVAWPDDFFPRFEVGCYGMDWCLNRRVEWLNGQAPPPEGWEDWTPIPVQAAEWTRQFAEHELKANTYLYMED